MNQSKQILGKLDKPQRAYWRGNSMVTIEYGKENNDVIMLLHGGGLSWWNYREVAESH